MSDERHMHFLTIGEHRHFGYTMRSWWYRVAFRMLGIYALKSHVYDFDVTRRQ
jgi:hypothetical protein